MNTQPKKDERGSERQGNYFGGCFVAQPVPAFYFQVIYE
jgi:hypothetical protein